MLSPKTQHGIQQPFASAGQNGSAMLAAMQNAAREQSRTRTLMLAANKAMLLGVADSADEMAGLWRSPQRMNQSDRGYRRAKPLVTS